MILVVVIVALISSIISVLIYRSMYARDESPPPVVKTARRPPRQWTRRLYRQRREPEFRGPPYQEYKPPRFQQMGILTNDDGTVLPLFGKQTIAHRDRFNYYTTSPGNQAFAIPLNFEDRDCTEDIGCQEFYGNEGVDVTGLGNFTVQKYKTKVFNP